MGKDTFYFIPPYYSCIKSKFGQASFILKLVDFRKGSLPDDKNNRSPLKSVEFTGAVGM